MTLLYGAAETAKLLILSQVILSLQLPFAVVPLVQFTAIARPRWAPLVAPRWLTCCSPVLIAAVIIALNVKLLWDTADRRQLRPRTRDRLTDSLRSALRRRPVSALAHAP